MPLVESDDFAAKRNDLSGALTVHGHHFPAANTALAHLLGLPESVNEPTGSFSKAACGWTSSACAPALPSTRR